MASTARRGGARRPEGTRRVQSERTELQLLRTATMLFSERGFHGTGIRDIAEAAGLAVSAMYYYARSKDELLEDVIRGGLDRLQDGARQALSEVDGASERLATLIGVHVALHARNPRTASVIDQEFGALPRKLREEILAERDAYEAIWESVLAQGVKAGEFVDRGTIARLGLLQMCTGVAHWYKPQGELTIPQLCERFADMGLSLVGAHRGDEGVTVQSLELPDPQTFLPLVDIGTEPRGRRPRG